MVIAVDMKGSGAYQNFIHETFKRITAQQPQHTFLFILDKPYDLSLVFSENVIPLIVSSVKASLLSQLRINHKIYSLLKKYKADVFVSTQTLSNTKIPQCLIASDNIPSKSLNKSSIILTHSEFAKKEIIEKYKINPDKICIVYNGVEEIYKPLLFDEKENVKEQYANGNEFFLITETLQSKKNVLDLLKAFSVFKKMQKSNMQLLIFVQTRVTKEIVEALRLFKFKSDVKILGKLDKKEHIKITGGAYAFISPFARDGYSHILEAMKCDVPVITNNVVGAIPEVASDAALYFNSNDYKDIADKMMLIYKDEKLRQHLIDKGREQVKKYNWEKSAPMLWMSIEKACR